MFSLSLVHLDCVHSTSPVHLLVGLGIVDFSKHVSKFLHLPNDDQLTMMYDRSLLQASALRQGFFCKQIKPLKKMHKHND